MITPDPRDDASQKRRFAALMTAGTVALAAALVAFVSVPEFQNPRDSFKEIDPAQLTQMQPQSEPEPSQPEESQEQEEPQEEAEETPERVEAPELNTDALQAEPSPSQTATSTSESDASSESESGGVEVERTQVGGLQSDDASASSGAGALPSTTDQPSAETGGGGGISVAETGEGSTGGGGEGEFAGGETVAAGGEEAGAEGEGETVAVQQAQQEDYKTSVESNKLIQWMKENPAPLPPGIEQLVGYQPKHLSSKIKELSTSEGQYEMYLMCKQSLREIHIVLVRDGQAKYLVDRSFQKQSRKFRVGPVRRSGGTIVGVQNQAKARGEESKQFYSVFLSWWQEAKTDV